VPRTWSRERAIPGANLQAAPPEAAHRRPGLRHQSLHHTRDVALRVTLRGGGAAHRLSRPRLGSDMDISQANDTVVYIGNKLEAIISDLTPGKSYFLRVLAFSQGGEGKMSSPAWQFQMGDPDRLNGATLLAAGRLWSLVISLVVPLVLWRIV